MDSATIATNSAIERPPKRVALLASTLEATAVITSEISSGITVIRMAFTQSVPMGSTKSDTRCSNGEPEDSMNTPASSPPTSPSRIHHDSR